MPRQSIQIAGFHFFEVKVTYLGLNDDGQEKYITEPYLVQAHDVITAEATLAYSLHGRINEYMVESITKPRIHEVHAEGGKEAGGYWKAKVSYLTLDEKTGAEKSETQRIVVQANDFDEARKALGDALPITSDYEIEILQLTPYVDYFVQAMPRVDVEAVPLEE